MRAARDTRGAAEVTARKRPPVLPARFDVLRQGRPYLNELLFPYRGAWNLPQVAQRYARTARSGFTLSRLLNAACAFAEMRCGVVQPRSKPVVLRIEPVNTCNLRCPRCSCGLGTDPRPKGFMKLDDYARVLAENVQNAVLVRLDGNGEPTLHPEIFEMISRARAHGYSVSMSSNLDTPGCTDPVPFIESGLDRLVIAIDGTTQASYERYRVRGRLARVEQHALALLEERVKRKRRAPFVEVQFLDWGYNHAEIPEMRRKVRRWGADKLEVISPDWAVTGATPGLKPRRCFWLWTTLTVDWDLNYHSCTNAWTLPFPRLNLRETPSHDFWVDRSMVEARRFNLDKSSAVVASDAGCHCNQCSDMLVVARPPGYVCE